MRLNSSLDVCLNFHGRVPVCVRIVGVDLKRSAVKVVAAASLDICLNFHSCIPICLCRVLFRPQRATKYKAWLSGRLTARNWKYSSETQIAIS